MSILLGVNVDHVATLRQARGTSYPCPVAAARLCAGAGAHGVTVHLREDRRHIQDADVRALAADRFLPLNLEMANASEIVDIALELKPDEACLVPERRAELTTEGGLDVIGAGESLRTSVERMLEPGIAVSLFIDPDPEQIHAAAELKVPVIELHTGTFCDASGPEAAAELERLQAGAELAHSLGLVVNAGHGIHLGNLEMIMEIPHLHMLNIGHSIISQAVFVGLEQVIRDYIVKLG